MIREGDSSAFAASPLNPDAARVVDFLFSSDYRESHPAVLQLPRYLHEYAAPTKIHWIY